MLEAFRDGFFRYDMFIFAAFIANIVFFIVTNRYIKKVDKIFRTRNNRASARVGEVMAYTAPTKPEVDEANEQIKQANFWHSVFINVISAFPLLGILGTVFALLGVATDGGLEGSQQSFLVALTSTAWGVVCSMIFKVLFDPNVSPKLEKLNIEVNNLELERKGLIGDLENQTDR